MIWCLHGAVGMAGDWAFFVSRDRGNRRALDLWEWIGFSLEEVGRKLVEMSEAGDFLLGYSMGGRLALQGLLAEPGHWGGGGGGVGASGGW